MMNIRYGLVAIALLFVLQTAGSAQEGKRTVAQLIHDLQSSEPDQRERAAQALAQWGPEAEPAMNALRRALNDDFPYVRTHSAQALSKIGPAAIPAFREAMKNPNGDVRVIAASALGQYGSQANQAIPELANALLDADSPVRQRAVHSLEQIGAEAVPPLLHFLDGHKGSPAKLALEALGGIRTTNKTLVPGLMKVLEDSDPQIRLAATKTLARQGPDHVSELIGGLQSDSAAVRALVADVLADVGKQAAQAVPLLIDLLEDPAPSVRGSCARALGHMGSAATTKAIPALKKLREDSDPTVATRAKEALTNLTSAIEPTEIAPEKSRLLPGVIDDGTSSPPAVKTAVKQPAKSIPKTVSKAVNKKQKKALSISQLIKQLQSPDETVRTAAVQSLIQVKAQAIPVLTQSLQDGATAVRQPVALVFIQVDSATAVQAFADCAQGGDLGVRLDALHALQTMGAEAKGATPRLLDLLKDPSNEIQSAAEKVLDKIGTEESKKALEAYYQRQFQKTIASLVKDLRQEGKISKEAAAALVKLGAPAVKAVAPILADPRPQNRVAAAQVLNQLGTLSAPASSDLIHALDDSDPGVRQAAAETLVKIATPDAKNALRFFPVKEQYRKLLKMLHLG